MQSEYMYDTDSSNTGDGANDVGQAAASAHARSGHNMLYPGDCSAVPREVRNVYSQLLRGPALDSTRHPRLWPTLVAQEAMVRSLLSVAYLELILDIDAGFAFTRNADTESSDTPTLLRTRRLKFNHSVLMLHLRQRIAEADAKGERATISDDDMQALMAVYAGRENLDSVGYAKHVNAAIDKMKEHNFLHKIRGSEDRYEISATLKVLITPEEIVRMRDLYKVISSPAELVVAEDANNETLTQDDAS